MGRVSPSKGSGRQAITIAEERFDSYCGRPDFIQRFVFPGGFLSSKTFVRDALEGADLKIVSAENFGESYALTLREWRRRFLEKWLQVERLGFDAPLRRLWECYLLSMLGRLPRAHDRRRPLFHPASSRLS